MNRTGRKLKRAMTKLLNRRGMNAGEVTLRWRERGELAGFDPQLDGDNPDYEWRERSEKKRAFIHEVNVHTSGVQRFGEVRTGDVILDFPGEVCIDGRDGLEFDIGGILYVQKNGGDELVKSWDVRCGGTPITRSVLLTLKS